MLSSARLTLKQHRFELVSVVVAALLVGAAGLWFNARLLGFNVPEGCFDAWLDSAGPPGLACTEPVQAYAAFLYSNTTWFDPAMVVLPFLVGMLTGAPLVARELENRTAQTAWSLSPSRTRWLTRQIWPTLILVGAAVAFAAASASVLHETRSAGFSSPSFGLPGFHGPLVVARGLVTFGIGVLIGAVVGRSLPAVILTALACLVLFFGAISARDIWLHAQPRELVTQADYDAGDVVLTYETFWMAPDGTLLEEDEAYALVPDGEEDPYSWLIDADYGNAGRGITAETASQWEPIEIAGTVALGAVLIGAAYPVVNRRRPT